MSDPYGDPYEDPTILFGANEVPVPEDSFTANKVTEDSLLEQALSVSPPRADADNDYLEGVFRDIPQEPESATAADPTKDTEAGFTLLDRLRRRHRVPLRWDSRLRFPRPNFFPTKRMKFDAKFQRRFVQGFVGDDTELVAFLVEIQRRLVKGEGTRITRDEWKRLEEFMARKDLSEDTKEHVVTPIFFAVFYVFKIRGAARE